MADRPETVSLRLAEAATPGPWYLSLAGDYETHATVRAKRGAIGPLLAHVERSAGVPTASHIANAHPGRVAAWLGCVARLRERVAEGHALECETRMPTMMALARGEPGECDCGHDLDLAALGAVDAEG